MKTCVPCMVVNVQKFNNFTVFKCFVLLKNIYNDYYYLREELGLLSYHAIKLIKMLNNHETIPVCLFRSKRFLLIFTRLVYVRVR